MIVIKLETSLTNMIRHQHQVDVEVYYKKTGEHIQTLSDDGEAACTEKTAWWTGMKMAMKIHNYHFTLDNE